MKLGSLLHYFYMRQKFKKIEEKYPKESDSYKNYADRCLNCGLKLHVPEKYCPNCGKIMESWKDNEIKKQ